MVFFRNWGLFLHFENRAGQTTAKETALKPISLSPSNIPQTAFPFSQWRGSWQYRTIPAPSWGSRGSTLFLLPCSSPPFHPEARLASPLARARQNICFESGQQPGWEESRRALLPWQLRAPWAQNPSSSHSQGPALVGCPQPSHLTFSSPQQHFLQAMDTGTPLLPAAHCTSSSSCSLSYKTSYHPQTHIFSKHSSHFLFASPSPSLSWVLLLFVLAILGWRLFGEGNTV